MVMFLEQSHVFFWKFCEDPTWFGWDIKLSFKTRPGNLDNSRHFCVWLLDYFHACPPRKCILWWIFSVTTLCKYKKYEMYVLMGLGMNLMINYTNNVWEPSWAQNLLLHMQTFYGRNHWQTILGASTGAMTAKEYRQDTFKILTIIGLTKLTKLTNPHYIYNTN